MIPDDPSLGAPAAPRPSPTITCDDVGTKRAPDGWKLLPDAEYQALVRHSQMLNHVACLVTDFCIQEETTTAIAVEILKLEYEKLKAEKRLKEIYDQEIID